MFENAGRIPSYRRHKATGQAIVTVNGRDLYLGKHGSHASRSKYKRLIAEWSVGATRASADLTIAELVQRYRKFAKDYYRGADGKQTCEVENIRKACRILRELYGETAAEEFGPLKLQAVRGAMINHGKCRTSINRDVSRLKRLFKWAAAQELVPPNVFHGLQSVSGLRIGRSGARESEPVKPVPQAFVDAVLDQVTPTVAAMIRLQLLTAMRPGELIAMRGCDLDTSGRIWTYSPESHKTAYRGHRRTVYLGPQGQQILKPFLQADLTVYLFSPRESLRQSMDSRHAARKTPLSCGNRPGTNRVRKPKRMAGNSYTVNSYGRAIRRACERANVPKWSPHRLRHNAATFLRKEFGLDVARVVLGHRSPQITEVYAELDEAKAMEVVAQVG